MVDPQNSEYRRAISTVLVVTTLVALVLALSALYRRVLMSETSEYSHIQDNSVSPIAYESVPPISGPHYGTIANWAVYTEPLRYEQVLHNLEHGGVAIYYQCEQACPALVTQLEDIVAPYLASGRKVLLLPNVPTWKPLYNRPYHQDMETRIAVTTWHQIEKYNEVEPTKIQAFIEQYEGIDNHQASE
jgi:hypothetical protein